MNKGLDLKKEQDDLIGNEWQFGADSKPSLFSIAIGVRENYLPIGELQNIGEEKMDCVTRAYINKLEIEFTYAYQNNLISEENKKWLESNNYIVDNKVVFSDAFIGIISGTTRNGNSLKAPAHAIYKNGLIPKSLLPQLNTFDEHYNPERVTSSMFKLGGEFLKRFPINYEQVNMVNLEKAIEKDMTVIAIPAYGQLVNGEYQRIEDQANHSVLAFKLPKTYIFDNYLDSYDGDFIKKLASNYSIYPYGYRIYIDQEKIIRDWSFKEIIKSILEALGIIQNRVNELKKEEITPPVESIMPVVESKPSEVYNEVKEELKQKYDWSTKIATRHSCRVIMDEFKLTKKEKDLLCAVIQAESNFDTQAVNQNTDQYKSVDWGLCQINDYYWIGSGKRFPSVKYVLDYPEESVKFMIECYKKGKLSWWHAWNNGSYKRFL